MDNYLKVAMAAPAIAVLALLTACSGGGGGNSGSVHAAASSIAANPTVKADEQAAVRIVQGCTGLAHIADVKGCIEKHFSPDARTALVQCLAKAGASAIGPGAKAKFAAGAQACVATALEANTVSSMASIPGVTVTPSAAVTATPSASAS